MKQDLKTLITIRVKAPTVLEQKKLNDIFDVLTAQIITPFMCEPKVSYVYNTPRDGTMSFYIFKKGKLKRSQSKKMLASLDFLVKYWPGMIEYSVGNVTLEQI